MEAIWFNFHKFNTVFSTSELYMHIQKCENYTRIYILEVLLLSFFITE